MNTVLFFLRSSEQKIASNIVKHALCVDNVDSSFSDLYVKAYGLKTTDMGVYSLTNNVISGAAWVRLFQEDDNVDAYIDDSVPVLLIGVLPEFRGKGVGTSLMKQLLDEAAVMYDQISVCVMNDSNTIAFYNQFGFTTLNSSEKKRAVDGSDVLTMVKRLTKKAIVRPTDGYDPRRWMD